MSVGVGVNGDGGGPELAQTSSPDEMKTTATDWGTSASNSGGLGAQFAGEGEGNGGGRRGL